MIPSMQSSEDDFAAHHQSTGATNANIETTNGPASNDSLSSDLARLALSTSQTLSHSQSPNTVNWSGSTSTGRNTSPILHRQASQSKLGRSPSSTPVRGHEHVTAPSLHNKSSLTSLRGSKTPPQSPVGRRASSYVLPSASPSRSSLPPPAEEASKLAPTAASVAREFFDNELNESHGSSTPNRDARTVVIIQDDCYGHRFSRPKTSKASLSTIVERPERIKAALKGVAAAYVRLGGRHADGSAPPHPKCSPSSPSRIPFSIYKTSRRMRLDSPASTFVHGLDWMRELKIMCETAESKLVASGKELFRPTLTEDPGNATQEPKPRLHEGDLYLCSDSLPALEGSIGGVCEAVDKVFEEGQCKRSFVCIRPPGHHCSADMPSGFCWLNNVHIGIAYAAATHALSHAAIIDFDLHHGDGSQAISWAHNRRAAALPKNAPSTKKTSIGYFSLHDINSYPCEAGDEDKVRNASLCIENAHGQSIWNVHLQPWKTEAEFWKLYEEQYSRVLDKARGFLRVHSDRFRHSHANVKPKAAIFLSAGFDASEWESPFMQRHKVNVPTSFYARFTRDVIQMANEVDLAVDGRVISVLEGGYSDRALASGVFSHLCGLTGDPLSPDGSRTVSSDTSHGEATIDMQSTPGNDAKSQQQSYDPTWWSLPFLEDLENGTQPKPAIEPTKRVRNEVKPTYTTATESYRAKIIAPPIGRRSLSGNVLAQHSSLNAGARSPTPPPPEVDWVTATSELCNLLVPTDRQTRSCRAEELNAEATRVRRDRQSGEAIEGEIGSTDLPRMQLREKRAKKPPPITDEAALPSNRATRRRTIADVKLLSTDHKASQALSGEAPDNESRKATRRRSSAASSVASLASDLSSGVLTRISEGDKHAEQSNATNTRLLPTRRPQSSKNKVNKRQDTALGSSASAASDGDTSKKTQLPARSDSRSVPASDRAVEGTDVDLIASGMKKMSLKLKVPPKEEYEARRRKPKGVTGTGSERDATKSTKSRSPKKSKNKAKSLPESSHASAEKRQMPSEAPALPKEHPVQSIQVSPTAFDNLDPLAGAQVSDQPAVIAQTDKTSLSSPAPSEQEKMANPKDPHPTNVTSNLDPMPESLSGSPVAIRRTRQDLPVFTANSAIAFSPKIAGENHIHPDDQAFPVGAPLVSRSSNGQAHATTGGKTRDEEVKTQAIKEDSVDDQKSIWDVPDTPLLKR